MGIRGLNSTQINWAKKIIARVKARGFGGDGPAIAQIALMTALTESALYMYANRYNAASLRLPHDKVGGDHGSVGLFQQQVGGAPRSTANWGTTAQLMDVNTSTDKFVNALRRFDWKSMSKGRAAQKVQVSAFPDRYAFYEGWAKDLVNAYWGGASGGGGPAVSSKDPDVVKQQTWLNRSRNAKLAVDGLRGPKTIAAFKEYQKFLKKNYGYTGAIDGIWGKGTQAAHQKYYNAFNKKTKKPTKSRPTLRRGSKGSDVGDLQKHLKKNYPLYASKLKVDKIFGPATEAAVEEFQRRSGLVADGIVGPKTWKKLGI